MPLKDWLNETSTVCLIDWATRYLHYAKTRFSPKTYQEKGSVFRRFFKQVDPSQPVDDLSAGQVLDCIQVEATKRTGYAANKDRKNLVAAWNWGIKYMGLPSPNPCLVDRMPEERQPRYIPPEEDFWRVYDAAEGQDKVMLLTFLHLGARRGEVFRLSWSDVDFGSTRIRLWTRKRKGANLEYDWLPMTQELREALMWWWENRPIKDNPYIFLCLEKTPFCQEYYGQPFRYRLQFMRRLCDRAGVKRFGFHAIRHLSASILYNLGYEPAVMQTILRHKNPSTTDRYLKSLGLEGTRQALEGLSKKRGNVLEFTAKRAKKGDPKKKPSEEPSSPQTAKVRLRVVR